MNKERLKHFKRRLQDLRARVEDDFEGLRASIVQESAHPDEPSHLPTHAADLDAEGLDVTLIMAQTEAETLAATEEALVRIEKGTYGICEECGKPIAEARLVAIPYAARCIDCA